MERFINSNPGLRSRFDKIIHIENYNEKELTQIKDRVNELARAFRTLTVITNNHYKGAELANALELKCLLTGEKQYVPDGMLKAYPSLAKIALNG